MAIQDEIPKSRLTLRYRTEINGAPADITLPYRLLVLGDFSKGSSKDRKVDLDERRLRNMTGSNTDAVMADMGISLKVNVLNRIDGDGESQMEVTLPFTGIKSFAPDQVAQNVPKLNGLLTLKKLLEEVIADADNRKEFRRLLDEVVSHPDEYEKLVGELKDFEGLRLPPPKAADAESGAAEPAT